MRPLFRSSLDKMKLTSLKASKPWSGASGSRQWREINADDTTPMRKHNTSLPSEEDAVEGYSARGWAESRKGTTKTRSLA